MTSFGDGSSVKSDRLRARMSSNTSLTRVGCISVAKMSATLSKSLLSKVVVAGCTRVIAEKHQ